MDVIMDYVHRAWDLVGSIFPSEAETEYSFCIRQPDI